VAEPVLDRPAACPVLLAPSAPRASPAGFKDEDPCLPLSGLSPTVVPEPAAQSPLPAPVPPPLSSTTVLPPTYDAGQTVPDTAYVEIGSRAGEVHHPTLIRPRLPPSPPHPPCPPPRTTTP